MASAVAQQPGRRRIAVVTVGRSDFSILKPLVGQLISDGGFDAGLWIGGAHFDPAGGMTVDDVHASGLPVWAEIRPEEYGTGPIGAARSMATQITGFAAAAASTPQPDLVLILGDRFEAVAAGLALVPFGLPIGHLSGGSITEGAIDDVFRHCLTKMAALHFCDIPEFARRIQQMGEEPRRIFTVGALGLDGIAARQPASLEAFRARFELGDLAPGYAVATLHPETRAPGETGPMAAAMVAALAEAGRPTIYTYPNADPGYEEIVEAIEAAARTVPGHHVVRSFGSEWFYTAMSHAGLVIGNSSSGIIEAASFGLPVIDIGERQKGRFHGENVLHCGRTQADIAKALEKATGKTMTTVCREMVNPYGDGRGAARIMSVLKGVDWDWLKRPKAFADVDGAFDGAMVRLT